MTFERSWEIVQLNEDSSNGGGDDQRELAGELDRLSQAVARVPEFGFSLDLNLSRTPTSAPCSTGCSCAFRTSLP